MKIFAKNCIVKMNQKKILFILVFLPNILFSQKDSTKFPHFGILGSFDLAYNFSDKVLNPCLGRKWSFAATFRDKKERFVVFAGAGIKGAKLNGYSPTFRKSFLNEVEQNYVPINGYTEDSLIGAKMNSSPGGSLWGTYSQYIHVGFILNSKIKPAISFYMGREDFLLHDNSFTHFEDPKNGDIDYVGMTALFYELKIGCGIPIKWFSPDNPHALNLNIGFKHVNYGDMSFDDTSLSEYTKGNLAEKYSLNEKCTLSISYIAWTDWLLFR